MLAFIVGLAVGSFITAALYEYRRRHLPTNNPSE